MMSYMRYKAAARVIFVLLALGSPLIANEAEIEPAHKQTDLLRQWQELKLGMFIHYGLTTFTGSWQTNRNASPAAYAPTNLDVKQWIRTARSTGMKYAVLTAKHTLGHCLWDSADYTYDVAASTEKTDVIDLFIRTCCEEGIMPGLYYCVLDIYNEGGDTLKWEADVRDVVWRMSL